MTQVNLMEESNVLEGDAKNQSAYFKSLIPKYSQKSFFRVLKFYYIWTVLIITHWYVFFYL